MKNLITKDIVIYLIALALVLFFGISQISPKFVSLIDTNKKITDIEPQVADLERQVREKPGNSAPDKQLNQSGMPNIQIYKSPYKGITADNASSFLISTLIEKIRKNNIVVTKIAYNDFSTNNTGITLPATSKALNITFDLVTNYKSLQRLVETIQTWEYLVGIKDITVKRSSTNDNKIDASLTIILFVEGAS